MQNKWDQRFSEPGFAYGTEPNDFLSESLHHLKPAGSVLCLAEGEGRNSVFLAQKGFEVTAVDSSAVGLQKAKALASDRGVTISTTVADLTDYQLPPDTYDAIVSIFCHLPPPVRKKLYSQIVPSLKNGGIFLLEGYSPRQLSYNTGGPPVRELLVELDEAQEELKPLRFIHGMELERDIYEGRLHTGLGAVVQIIGVKE